MLCENMQKIFEQSEHLMWEIRSTRLTGYVRTYKSCLSNQNILSKNSEALDLHPILEHAKIIWAIRHFFWEIRTRLTNYVRTCKDCLSNQNILSKNSAALDLHPILEHAKIIWAIRHLFWEIRNTRLTCYVRTCKECLSDQNISSKKSEALDLHPMLEHTKVIWAIRTFLLRNYKYSPAILEHAKVWALRTSFLRNQGHCTHPLL